MTEVLSPSSIHVATMQHHAFTDKILQGNFLYIATLVCDMKIRIARMRDAYGIAPLFLQFWTAHRNCGDPQLVLAKERSIEEETVAAKRYLRKDGTFFIIAEEEDQIVGYLEIIIKKNPPLFKVKKYGYFDSIVIDEKYRRKGLGSRLVKEGVRLLKKKKIPFVKTNVYLSNQSAIDFWKNEGFKEVNTFMMKTI